MNWRRRRRRFRLFPPIAIASVALAIALACAAPGASGAGTARDAPTTTTAPAWDPSSDVIAPNVSIGGVDVSGMTKDAATAAVNAAYDGPFGIVIAGHRMGTSTASLGQVLYTDAAIGQAYKVGRSTPLPANGGATVLSLRIGVKAGGVAKWETKVAAKVLVAAVDAHVKLTKSHAIKVVKSKDGVKLNATRFKALITAQLTRMNAAHQLGTRTNLLTALHAKVTTKSLPAAIVIHRDENRLYLYSPTHLIKIYKVATGQAIYPTPLGTFSIVTKQRNPWWYPPTQDAWAKGLKPVPPGPDNPLGTRWMGLSIPGVGIHGTDEPTSIGYSASHGCVRMEVPDAEAVFKVVSVGTPVFIVH